MPCESARQSLIYLGDSHLRTGPGTAAGTMSSCEEQGAGTGPGRQEDSLELVKTAPKN